MARARRIGQNDFAFLRWGGARKGAGRKREGPRRRVPHVARAAHAARHPLHVTLRMRDGLPSLRETRTHRVLVRALADAADRNGLRLVHYSAQTNHLHLVCEAEHEKGLSRGLQGLCVRIARRLNRCWRRRGRVFDDRFHARTLKTPREVRVALHYLFHNARHHGFHPGRAFDPCSSATSFDGWTRTDRVGALAEQAPPLARARTWLLSIGWKRWGLLEPA